MPEIFAPMAGKIVSVKVKIGDKIKKNDIVATIEAMNTITNIYAPAGGEVAEIFVSPEEIVTTEKPLLVIK